MLRTFLVIFMLVAAVAVGGVTWVALTPPEPPAPAAEAAPVSPRALYLVAARPVRAGALLRAEDIGAAEMEIAAAPPGAQRDAREVRAEMIGAMIRRTMPQGEPIRPNDLLRPGERGFLAAILAPDMRAFAVAVDVVTGAAGLIWPGDRVDLLLTQQMQDEAIPAYRRLFGETVLTDVRVIAVDQAIMQGAVGDGPEPSRQSRTVTLELTARQSEIAAVATRLGRLSLLLRSASETGPADAVAVAGPRDGVFRFPPPDVAGGTRPDEPSPVWAGDVSPGLRQGRINSAPPKTMQIFSGGTRREEFRF